MVRGPERKGGAPGEVFDGGHAVVPLDQGAVSNHTLRRLRCRAGSADLLVFKLAIDALAKTIAAGEVRNDHGQHRITASVLARELGIRTEGWYRSLVESVCRTGSWGNHPVTNVRTLYVSDEDILQFNRRFITLQQMQAEFGLHRHTCLSKLRAAAVRPFSMGRQTFGPLYERSHVVDVLRPASPTVFPIAER